MSTTGIAHHQRGTFPVIDGEAVSAARRARFAPRDSAYRAALGIGHDEPLPSRLGSISTGAGKTFGTASGGRLRGRQVVSL